MDLTYAYRDEMKVIEEDKYEPKIEGAKSEIKTITKELGLNDCGLCGVEYFRGEGQSKGDRCVDCIDKVDCVHCLKRIHKADLVECQQCTEQVCVDCLEEGCGQCERRFCYECRDGFTKQRCGGCIYVWAMQSISRRLLWLSRVLLEFLLWKVLWLLLLTRTRLIEVK